MHRFLLQKGIFYPSFIKHDTVAQFLFRKFQKIPVIKAHNSEVCFSKSAYVIKYNENEFHGSWFPGKCLK